MPYLVKEIYYTLQGEGIHAGRAAVFCRFSGCNLWSGLEEDRARATCSFCDTDFLGTDGPQGGRYGSASDLAATIARQWPPQVGGLRLVVFTGGEPALQLDAPLVAAVREAGFQAAIETNGTRKLPAGLDHVCVSPKAGTNVVVRAGQELKIVYPQPGVDPAAFASWAFEAKLLQPLDDANRIANTEAAIRYCLENPAWRLSTQRHKEWCIP